MGLALMSIAVVIMVLLIAQLTVHELATPHAAVSHPERSTEEPVCNCSGLNNDGVYDGDFTDTVNWPNFGRVCVTQVRF